MWLSHSQVWIETLRRAWVTQVAFAFFLASGYGFNSNQTVTRVAICNFQLCTLDANQNDPITIILWRVLALIPGTRASTTARTTSVVLTKAETEHLLPAVASSVAASHLRAIPIRAAVTHRVPTSSL